MCTAQLQDVSQAKPGLIRTVLVINSLCGKNGIWWEDYEVAKAAPFWPKEWTPTALRLASQIMTYNGDPF